MIDADSAVTGVNEAGTRSLTPRLQEDDPTTNPRLTHEFGWCDIFGPPVPGPQPRRP